MTKLYNNKSDFLIEWNKLYNLPDLDLIDLENYQSAQTFFEIVLFLHEKNSLLRFRLGKSEISIYRSFIEIICFLLDRDEKIEKLMRAYNEQRWNLYFQEDSQLMITMLDNYLLMFNDALSLVLNKRNGRPINFPY